MHFVGPYYPFTQECTVQKTKNILFCRKIPHFSLSYITRFPQISFAILHRKILLNFASTFSVVSFSVPAVRNCWSLLTIWSFLKHIIPVCRPALKNQMRYEDEVLAYLVINVHVYVCVCVYMYIYFHRLVDNKQFLLHTDVVINKSYAIRECIQLFSRVTLVHWP